MTVYLLRASFVIAVLGSGLSSLWGQLPVPEPLGQSISSGRVTVVVPRSRDAVLAYSVTTGRWCKQPIKATSTTRIIPVLGNDVVAVKIDNNVFAFGAAKGRWDSVSLPSDSKAVPIVASNTTAEIHTEHTYYVFSSETCQWSSVNLDTGAVNPEAWND